MVKRKRIASQNNQDEKVEDGATSSGEATDNRIVGGGGIAAEPPAATSGSVMPTRSRSQLLTAAAVRSQPPQSATDPAATEPADGVPMTTAAETEAKPVVAPRSSARVSNKRFRKEDVPSTSKNSVQSPPVVKKSPIVGKTNITKPGNPRTRRSWELWSVDDKNAFFEALCEYGKDFENIQLHIAQKSKKRGISPNMIKNKDQVRFFYYRTWHKILKVLDVGEDVNKHTLELYGLINYAELRKKKGGCLNEKNKQKLNELIFRGVTTVKCKGKTFRIRTPVCKALKKLNNIEETKEPELPKLPKDVMVELRPKTNAGWTHVQSLAQNPRIRTRISLQKRLSTLLAYLEKRWKPHRLRQKEKILESMPELAKATTAEKSPNLRVYLKSDATLCTLSVASVDSPCSADVCLNNYIKGLVSNELVKETGKSKKLVRTRILPLNAIQNKASAKTDGSETESTIVESKDVKTEVETKNDSDPKDESDTTDAESEAEKSLSLLKTMIQSYDGKTSVDSELLTGNSAGDSSASRKESDIYVPTEDKVLENSCPVAINLFIANQRDNQNLTLGQFLSMSAETDEKEGKNSEFESKLGYSGEESKAEEEIERSKKRQEDLMNKIRKGWIREECRTLTIGELYLMLNNPEKIILEYDFELSGDPQVKVVPESGPEEVRIPQKMQVHHLTEILDRLVSVSNLYFTDFKTKQTPLSPTNRVPQTKGAGGSRGQKSAAATKPKPTTSSIGVNTMHDILGRNAPKSNIGKDNSSPNTTLSSTSTSNLLNAEKDKYTFAMPMRTAPRPIKIASNPRNDSVIQQLDKLVAIQCRQQRPRNRRPLVVPRPLLPSAADNSGMTVVHLLPSSSPIVSNVGGVKKIILPKQPEIYPKPPMGLQSLQILNPIVPRPRELILTPTRVLVSSTIPQTTIIPTTHAVINTRVPLPSNALNAQKSLISLHSPLEGMNSTINLNPLSLNVISPHENVQTIRNLRITAGTGSDPPQISIPETPNVTRLLGMTTQTPVPQSSSFSPNICSLLDLGGLNQMHAESDHLMDFNSNSSISSSFGISTKSGSSSNLPNPVLKRGNYHDPLVSNRVQSTPPHSPNGSRFKVNSPGPEGNWLNGESSDFSLSSLLNTLESPIKNIPVCGPTDNSTLDAMSRLGPEVDTHLQCLINENSVDYVKKFADLAAQIAENKCT